MLTGAVTALIIDADDSRSCLAVALQDAGFRVIETSDSGEGVEHALGDSPSILVIGEEMPPLGGVELLAELRRLTDSPIIALGIGGEIATVQALLGGADVYLTRPVNLRELMARIRALLRRYDVVRETDAGHQAHCQN